MNESPRTLEMYRQTAVDLVRMAGAEALACCGRVDVQRKADRSPTTQVDHDIQVRLIERLTSRFRDHAILAEERTGDASIGMSERAKASPYCWVIDPIDGTRNFIRGSKLFAVSLALLYEGAPLAGAIFDASSSAVYSVAAGSRPLLDDMVLPPIDRSLDVDSTLALSSFRSHPPPPGIRRMLEKILFRNVGSACLHLAWIAAGRLDGMYGPDCRLWDVAAGALLVSEAGGIVSDERGHPRWPADPRGAHETRFGIVAATPAMHRLIMEHLSEP
jgi:myo-inositol-1(or 4)-monophosphatase